MPVVTLRWMSSVFHVAYLPTFVGNHDHEDGNQTSHHWVQNIFWPKEFSALRQSIG